MEVFRPRPHPRGWPQASLSRTRPSSRERRGPWGRCDGVGSLKGGRGMTILRVLRGVEAGEVLGVDEKGVSPRV